MSGAALTGANDKCPLTGEPMPRGTRACVLELSVCRELSGKELRLHHTLAHASRKRRMSRTEKGSNNDSGAFGVASLFGSDSAPTLLHHGPAVYAADPVSVLLSSSSEKVGSRRKLEGNAVMVFFIFIWHIMGSFSTRALAASYEV